MLTPPPLFRPPAPGERLRVVDLVPLHSPISGGMRRFIEDKCRYFETTPEVEHCVIAPGETHGEDLWGASRVHTLASPRLPGSAGHRVLRDRDGIRRILRSFRPHVIEAGDPYLTAWIGRGLAEELPARLVGVCHSDHARLWQRRVGRLAGAGPGRWLARATTAYFKRVYGHMDALVAPTPQLAAFWRRQGLRHVRHIPPGVDTGRFYPRGPEETARTRAQWALPPEARVILFAGRLAREKRIDWLVRIFDELKRGEPHLHLVLVGDGEWRERARGWAAASGSRIQWCPHLHSADALAAAYSAADVFIHAGVDETFGLSLLEAQSCGLPAVASLGGGLDHVLLPQPGNALASAEDEAAWAGAIRAALTAGVAPGMRTARHAAVKGRFAWWSTYERLTNLYRELAGLPPPGRVTGQVRPLGRWVA